MGTGWSRRGTGRILWAALIVLSIGHQSEAGDSLSTILEGVRGKYCSAPGLGMDYRREVITRSMSMLGTAVKGDVAEGRIYYRSPYNLRVEQETPRKEILVTNGETLWWHIPDERITHHYPFEQYGRELRVLGDIFRGLVKVEDSFQVKVVTHDPQAGSAIELRPDPAWEQIDHIRVDISPGFDISRVEIHSVLGTITRFHLKGIRPQASFPQGFFQFNE